MIILRDNRVESAQILEKVNSVRRINTMNKSCVYYTDNILTLLLYTLVCTFILIFCNLY